MPGKLFHLLGEPSSTAQHFEVESTLDFQGLQFLIAGQFAIVEPNGMNLYSVLFNSRANHLIGIGFQSENSSLTSVAEVLANEEPIAISIDGKPVREIPGPKGLPFVGNFFEIYPDHLGNHQRLFDQYGPIFQTTNMGRTIYHTNDPQLSAIVFSESDFFTKKIIEAHPLHPIKNQEAGVFLGDTDTPEWRAAHKFLPPALGPKAVRHYAPTMQETVEDAFSVFDELDEQGEAWNVYQYMLKLGSQAVGKLVLGIDFKHFTSPNAPPHELVYRIAESLTLNKKVAAWGDWYAKMPFGDPKKLRDARWRITEMVNESIANASRGGVEDLPLQDAALKATNMVGEYILLIIPSFRIMWLMIEQTTPFVLQIIRARNCRRLA